MRTNFFELLRTERARRKMNIADFCEFIEVRPATYSGWSRAGQPTLGKAFRIMEILHLPISSLVLVDRAAHGNRKKPLKELKIQQNSIDSFLPMGLND